MNELIATAELMRPIQSLAELLLPLARREGRDGGDVCIVAAAADAENPPSRPSPTFVREGGALGHRCTSIEIGFEQIVGLKLAKQTSPK